MTLGKIERFGKSIHSEFLFRTQFDGFELALRGRPVDPLYKVGRMGDQTVVIRGEKGKVRMLVDGQGQKLQKELVYEARKRFRI
jgi:hypothetical protein